MAQICTNWPKSHSPRAPIDAPSFPECPLFPLKRARRNNKSHPSSQGAPLPSFNHSRPATWTDPSQVFLYQLVGQIVQQTVAPLYYIIEQQQRTITYTNHQLLEALRCHLPNNTTHHVHQKAQDPPNTEQSNTDLDITLQRGSANPSPNQATEHVQRSEPLPTSHNLDKNIVLGDRVQDILNSSTAQDIQKKLVQDMRNMIERLNAARTDFEGWASQINRNCTES